MPEFAHRFKIDEASLTIYSLGPTSFLLISPDGATALRILNAGQPIILPPGRLHVMRWSRFFGLSASVLPATEEIELCGIPAHAWELENAAQLLNEWCLSCGVLPKITIQRKIFRIAAWCSSPGDAPPMTYLKFLSLRLWEGATCGNGSASASLSRCSCGGWAVWMRLVLPPLH